MEAIVLLLVTLILTKQHGWYAVLIGQIAPREAQRSAGLLSSMIICQTLLNEVAKSIRGNVIRDLVFLDGSSVQLMETECSTAVRCEDSSGTMTFWHPYVVCRRLGASAGFL